jgi:hypothetical protein
MSNKLIFLTFSVGQYMFTTYQSHPAQWYGPTTNFSMVVAVEACLFPEDFMFQLTKTEFENLKSHIAILSFLGSHKLPKVFVLVIYFFEHHVLEQSDIKNQ